MPPGEPGFNRLAREASPYLKQHQHNPVDWYPWSEEAFERARREDKPLFLSVGYSTCHWCHVMERESFNNEEIAQIMNENFINVKVDREERPDVDRVYMTYVQAASGGGGWPMSCFLTPDLTPFVGATYFPPEDMYGRPGFKTVMREVIKAWKTRRDEIVSQSAQVMQQLDSLVKLESEGSVDKDQAGGALEKCASSLARRFDRKLGGFGPAPKFPRPVELNCMFMRAFQLQNAGDDEAANLPLQMALFTLLRMSAGGIFDQLGGGFARYSVDEYYHVPHFEKMVYDNAQLADAAVAAYRLSRQPRFARVARGVLDYVLRDMRHPDGGIFSAEDADSYDTRDEIKKEGAFYLWTADEIAAALGTEAAGFSKRYMVQTGGNCNLSTRSDPHKEFVGKNVLMDIVSAEEAAYAAGLDSSFGPAQSSSAAASDVPSVAELADARERLYKLREERPRPSLDNKVVVAWNGMTISALASAAMALDPAPACFPVTGCDPDDYLLAAERAAAFVRERLYHPTKRTLSRSFCDGVVSGAAFADDYAWIIHACLDLFEATGKVEYVKWAEELQLNMDDMFLDEQHGGYYQAPEGDASILIRIKDSDEGAEPCASSIAAWNLQRLGCIRGQHGSDDGAADARVTKIFEAFSSRITEMPLAVPQMICAFYLHSLGPPAQVVVALHPSDRQHGAELLKAAHRAPNPHKVIIPVHPDSVEEMAFWHDASPLVAEMVGAATTSAVFVCRNFTCQKPTTSAEDVGTLLRATRTTPTTFDLNWRGRNTV